MQHMRIIQIALLLFILFSPVLSTHAAVGGVAGSLASSPASAIVPLRKLKEQMMVMQMRRFDQMSLADYEKLKGKKLNFFQRLSFRLNKRRVHTLLKAYDDGDSPTTLSKISWLLKGLLLGPLALIFGYIFLQDDDRELIKWIWFGFAGFAIIVALILLSL